MTFIVLDNIFKLLQRFSQYYFGSTGQVEKITFIASDYNYL